MPKRFPWASQSHSQRQECEQDSILIIVPVGQGLIRANASEVIDVARLCHAHHWMEQQYAVHLIDRAFSQLLMRSMERVPRLESNDVPTPHAFQPGPHFSRRKTQILKVVIPRKLQNLETS